MQAGFIRLQDGKTYRWILTANSLVVGKHEFVCEQVGCRVWRLSRVRYGELDMQVVTLPHPACPPPVLPFFGSKRKATSHHRVTQ